MSPNCWIDWVDETSWPPLHWTKSKVKDPSFSIKVENLEESTKVTHVSILYISEILLRNRNWICIEFQTKETWPTYFYLCFASLIGSIKKRDTTRVGPFSYSNIKAPKNNYRRCRWWMIKGGKVQGPRVYKKPILYSFYILMSITTACRVYLLRLDAPMKAFDMAMSEIRSRPWVYEYTNTYPISYPPTNPTIIIFFYSTSNINNENRKSNCRWGSSIYLIQMSAYKLIRWRGTVCTS